MVKTTTIESFQTAQATVEDSPSDEITSAPTPLAALAERMVRERPAGDGHVGNPFDGMDIDVDPADAFGLVQAAVTAWLEERGRWAPPLEIRTQVERLMAASQQARPGPASSGTYTVGPDGLVNGYEPDAPTGAELPGMPVLPAAVSGDVSMVLKVPSDSVFGDDSEFVMSSSLANRARILTARHPDHLDHLEKLSVLYLWKKAGGKSRGRVIFGKTSKPSGLLKHFSEADFVIWLAADHCRAAGYRDRELEALLFHEMLHTAITEPDENTGRGGGPSLVPHELEVFRAEVEIYGLWAADLKDIAPAFQQVSLFDARLSQPSSDVDPADPGDADTIRDSAQVDELVNSPLVCSICGNPVDEEELSLEEVSEARQNPAVVLCETCGEDGVIAGDE